MTLQSTGSINFSDINVELNHTYNGQLSLNDADVRTLAGVGGSGTTISMSDLRGKSNAKTFVAYFVYTFTSREGGYQDIATNPIPYSSTVLVNGVQLYYLAQRYSLDGYVDVTLSLIGTLGSTHFNTITGDTGLTLSRSTANFAYGTSYSGTATSNWTWSFSPPTIPSAGQLMNWGGPNFYTGPGNRNRTITYT